MQQHRKRTTRNTAWIRKSPSLMFCEADKYHHRLQTTCCNTQERCDNAITVNESILCRIHQYKTHTLCKSGPDLYIADWLLRQYHAENKSKEIAEKKISITTDIPTCVSIKGIQVSTQNDINMQELKWYIIRGWSSNRNEVKQDI